jgi:tetratricopeptide (TPR) repeat protein
LRLSPEAGEALVAQTGGSPLLMLEVARALHARGIALEVASAEEIAESVALGVVPLVRRRLAALAPPTRRALHAAAALGDPSELALVAAASDLAPAQVERARLEAERASLIERQGDSTWRFAHPLFAEAVADDLAAQGGETATTVHLRVFEALDAQGDRDPYRVASHALRVRDRLGSATLVDRLRRAAQSAWRVYAVEEARTWQQRAVEVAEAAGHPPLERCDLLLELGELTIASGGVNAARACFDRAARFAREQRDAARLARAALGYAHRALVLDAQEQVIEWLRVAHAAPSGDPALEARVAARLGAEQVAANTGDRDAAERLLRDGVERARRTCDALGVAQVLADQSITRFSAADPHAALVLAREVEHCGRHAEDAEIEFRGLAEIATLQAELGDRAGVDEAVAACAAFAVRVPIPFARGVTHGMTAMVALLDGRLDAAREAMGAADRYGRATGGLGFGVVAVLQRFLLAREQQALADLVPELDGVKARFPALPGIGVLSGLAHALCGNAVPARAASERLLASLGTLPFDRTRLATLAAGAELAHRTNSVALARALDPLLAPFASLHAVVGNAACYLGSIEHALGLVAAADGRVGQARDRFARARHAHAAMGSGPWAARSAQYAAELTA